MPRTKPKPSDEQRHLDEIAALQTEVDKAEANWSIAKAQASALHKEYETRCRKLFDYVRSLNQPMPLFETWRLVPITELHLPGGIGAILEEAGLDTIGKLADHSKSGKRLTDIQHIGEAKAQAIEEALERFWAERKAKGIPDDKEAGEADQDGDGDED